MIKWPSSGLSLAPLSLTTEANGMIHSHARSGLTLAEGTEVFARGSAIARSFIHPYHCDQVEGIWWLRDAPRQDRMERRDDWIACSRPPAEVDRLVRKHSRGPFAVIAVQPGGELDPAIRDQYKSIGYRLGFTQPLMGHALEFGPEPTSPAVVERVLNHGLAEEISRAAQERQLLPEHFKLDAPIRLYAAWCGNELAGWVRSVDVEGSAWCTTMFVKPAWRRQGIGSALLQTMLRDDRTAGARSAVLLASHTGVKLYLNSGYQTIGLAAVFTPDRRSLPVGSVVEHPAQPYSR